MKNRFLGNFAVLTLALAGTFSIGAMAQTTQEGPGPSEQPSAPMEVGQEQPQAQQGPMGDQPDVQPSDVQPSDAQPTEAQPGGPSGEAPAKTDQGVARVSMIHGDVSTQRGDSGDWSAATLNQPVMTGDKVSTGDGARTELQLDFANIVRLGPNSKANVSNLTQKNIQIQLGQGLLNYTVSKDSEAEPEIDTPNVAVHPAHHDGVFRIEVRPDGDTLVIVRKGEVQIATPQGSAQVQSGEMATVRGNADEAQYKISPAPERDDWDRWNSDRDHMIQNAQSWHHTNKYYTGSQDLDAYGRWQNVPDYGDVWVPNEADGWAPYRDGNWTYEPYYGWTWVGYEPWGWAPYHYGRWFPYGGRWAWWPGPLYAGGFYRPFWAPAYVSFWGWGGGFGFGIGFGGWGGLGWLPIGPCDWVHPWWGGYGGRFGGVGGYRAGFNRFGGFAPLHGGTRFSNIANLHDAHVGRALSTVSAGRFGAGRVGAMAATRAQIGSAHMMAGNLPVVPSRASLSASGRAAAASTIRNGGSQRFFSTSHNNVARPASFEHQTASLRQSMAQSHVGAIPAGGRSESSARESSARGTSIGSTQKPSAGSFQAGRPSNNAERNEGSANAGANRGAESANRGESRSVGSENRGSENMGSANRSAASNAARGGTRASTGMSSPSGFRPFTPPSSSQASRGSESSASPTRSSSGSYWNRTGSSSAESRGMESRGTESRGSSAASGSYGRGSSSRPQLDMRQPIARGPSYGGYSRGLGSYGGSRSVPSYGGSHSAPSYGGSHSAPHMSAPHISAPHVSAPSHSSGGGGGHSSGGGHSGGGHGHR